MKHFLLIIVIIAFTFTLSAQDKAVISVLDFSVNNVSKNDMKSIISLFSSALFRTGKYTVIDVSRRDEILKELQFSLSGCSDESCQLEIGKMLSAEQIVVGDIGNVGNRYILTSKILETETGKTLKTSDGIYKNLDALIDDIFAFTDRLTAFEPEPVIARTEKDDSESVNSEPATVVLEEDINKNSNETDVSTEKSVIDNTKIEPEVKPAEPVPDIIPEKTKIKKDVDVRKIVTYSSLGVGVVSTLIGGYLFYDAVQFYNGTVDPAYQAYMDATADFDTYWATYTDYQDDLKTKAIIASSLTGGGLLLVGFGVTLFLLPEKVKENTDVAFFVNPKDGASTLAFNYSY